MPEAVRITLWINPNPKKMKADPLKPGEEPRSEPPLVFQSVARLNLTAASQSGFSQDGSSPGSDQNGTQQTPPNGVINQ
jgi:hypothetical protein